MLGVVTVFGGSEAADLGQRDCGDLAKFLVKVLVPILQLTSARTHTVCFL